MTEKDTAAEAVNRESSTKDHDFASDIRQIAESFGVLTKSTTTNAEELVDNLFQDAMSALYSATMIYGISAIRECMRKCDKEVIKGDPQNIRDFMELPCTDVAFMAVVEANKALIHQHFTPAESELYLSAIEKYGKEAKLEALRIAEQQKHSLSNPRTALERQAAKRKSIYRSVQPREPNVCYVFDDANSNKELVYAIIVSKYLRQIRINFRGSVTVRDWLVDGKLVLTNMDNPVTDLKGPFTIPQTKRIGVHAGFHSYLFATSGKNKTSKYDQILQHLLPLIEEHPDFSIMVTGHSLGAALATLCAFRLACEADIKHKPIRCISFASPRTGNLPFVRAFQELELRKDIVHLRVANKRDIITLHPDRLTVCTFCIQDYIFRHVGIKLTLYPEVPSKKQTKKQTYRLRHSTARLSRAHVLARDFRHSLWNTLATIGSMTIGCCKEDYTKHHSCLEYMDRLERAYQITMVDMHANDAKSAEAGAAEVETEDKVNAQSAEAVAEIETKEYRSDSTKQAMIDLVTNA